MVDCFHQITQDYCPLSQIDYDSIISGMFLQL